MKLLRIIAIIASLAILPCAAYCADVEVSVKVDNEIAPDTRNEIHAINNTLFQSMKDNKPLVMMNMFVEDGRKEKDLEKNVRETYEKLGTLAKDTAFNVLHEYLIDAKGNGVVPVTLPAEGNNKFIMNVDGGKGPLYISLLASSGNFNETMLTFVYMKTKDGWQLHTFHSGIYKVGDKDPVQWYEEAKDFYDKGWDVPAMQRMQIVATFLRPAPFIKYDKEDEMDAFVKKGAAETAKKYKFPFKATWVTGMPTIYGLDVAFVKGSLTPVIIYVTKYPLTKGIAIQEEVDAITAKIDKVIPGLTKGSDSVSYRIFSEPPLDTSKEYKYRSVSSKAK